MEASFCWCLVGRFRENKGLKALRGSGRTGEPNLTSSTCREGGTQERPWQGRALELSEHPSKWNFGPFAHRADAAGSQVSAASIRQAPCWIAPPMSPGKSCTFFFFFSTTDSLPGCTHPRLAGLHHPPCSGHEQLQISLLFWVAAILPAGRAGSGGSPGCSQFPCSFQCSHEMSFL